MTEPELEVDFAPAEEMALNHVDKEWIALTIRESIRDHYRGKMARFRDWFPVSAVTAIMLFALVQWNGYTVFRTHTEDRLAIIEGRALKAEAATSPGAVLGELAKLPSKEFRAALPALRTIAEKPVGEVKPDPVLLREVATKLHNASEGIPDYWPIAFRFIEFATSGLSSDVPPAGAPSSVMSDVMAIGHPQVFAHLKVILDHGSFRGLRFENCRIVFTVNPVQLQNVVFVDCVFEFPTVGIPNPYLMQAGRQLLGENLQQVVLNLG